MGANSGENSGFSGRGAGSEGDSASGAEGGPAALLGRAAASQRVHSAYLISGVGSAPRDAALTFVRALVCERDGATPCESCRACRLSAGGDDGDITIDGTGRKGPTYRHIGDHSDLLWTEREPGGTRVRIGQVWAIQAKLQQVIDEEDKANPLNDDELVDALKQHGIDIARRTVAKYRKQSSIPTARQRKEY